jgi:hypothetical protein
MSLLKLIQQQLGLSTTPANNFTLDASANNGTMKLARGNAGATTQDIITIDANGKASFPQGPVQAGPAFRANHDNIQTITASVWTKVAMDSEEFDTDDCFDLTNDRFTPNIAGYYQFNGAVYASSIANGTVFCSIYKNGTLYSYGAGIVHPGGISNVNDCIYMNGTTDYVELYVYATSTTIYGDKTATNFSGFLARKA